MRQEMNLEKLYSYLQFKTQHLPWLVMTMGKKKESWFF